MTVLKIANNDWPYLYQNCLFKYFSNTSSKKYLKPTLLTLLKPEIVNIFEAKSFDNF